MMRSVFFEGIEVECSIGLHDFEKVGKQRVLVDIELRLSVESAPMEDRVSETLDYDVVMREVLRVANARHYDLQETLAQAIYDVLRGLKDVEGVWVQTQKPDIYDGCKTVGYRLSDFS